jgi:flavin-dependent dehydrogenase
VIVERDASARQRPGETLHPGIEPLLRALHAWELVRPDERIRHPGIVSRRGTAESLERYGSDANGDWLGLQIPRAELDEALLASALRSGCELRRNTRAAGILERDGRVTGVRIGAGEALRASWTIDATGATRLLARWLGIAGRRLSVPLVARFGYVEGPTPGLDAAPVFQRDPNGWTWLARVSPRMVHWMRVRPGGDAVGPPREIASMPSVDGPRSADVSWMIASRLAGPGFFLTGDAAMRFDPSAGSGVLRAILSGMLAAHAIIKIAQGGTEEASLAAYVRWMRDRAHEVFGRLAREFPEFLPPPRVPGGHSN